MMSEITNSWMLHAGAADYCFVPNFRIAKFSESAGSLAEKQEKAYRIDGKAKKRKIIVDMFLSGKSKYEIREHVEASYSYINSTLLEGGYIEIDQRRATKHVVQYDLNGNFIAEYKSPLEAAMAVKTSCTNIRQTCGNVKGRTMAKGFIFKYKEE